MNQAQKPGKRIVSKAEHAKHAAAKYGLTLVGVTLGVFGFYSIANLIRLWLNRPSDISVPESIVALGFTGLLTIIDIFVLYVIAKAARTIDTGVPLTRANTADLPAPDSLVRASAEPVQAQEAVLLRASVETWAGQEEVLLRAAIDGQERA